MLAHLWFAFAVFCLLLAGAGLGVGLRRRMPDHLLDDEARDVVRLGMALLSTIAALVLSLLISSSYGVYEGQRNDLRTLAADVINLDATLRLYGDETRPIREMIRAGVAETVGQMWSKPTINRFSAPNSPAEKIHLSIFGLVPGNETQTLLKAQAVRLYEQIAQSRLRLYERSEPDLPTSLLVVLAGWMVCLFVSFCLFSPLKRTSVVALVLVAFSIAAALFLLLELSEPFSGLVRLSDRPLTKALPPL
ncbi:MAG: hypothetical protein ACK4JB_12330 [Reyranella sp.]